jgi:hypothetical protein
MQGVWPPLHGASADLEFLRFRRTDEMHM